MDYQKIRTVFNKYELDILKSFIEREQIKNDKKTLHDFINELINSHEKYILNQLGIKDKDSILSKFSEYINEYIDKDYKYGNNIYYIAEVSERVITDFIQFVKNKLMK